MCSVCGTSRIRAYRIELDIVTLSVRDCPDCDYHLEDLSFSQGTPSIPTLQLAAYRMRSKFPDEYKHQWHQAIEYIESEMLRQKSVQASKKTELRIRRNALWEERLLKQLLGDDL